MLDLLDLAAGGVPPEPQLARDAHPEARRMLQVRAFIAACVSAKRAVNLKRQRSAMFTPGLRAVPKRPPAL